MMLSQHFSLEEMEYSATAMRMGIVNKAPQEVIQRLTLLCENILEPLRIDIGRPVHIDSGYRCLELNRVLKSKDNSQHLLGEAADITIKGLTPEVVCDIVEERNFPFDQLIEEYGEWTHVSYSSRNRRQRFILP